ncbi:MAG: hypothetical protein KC457_08165, partial [Myxococcales bacterium]|nr:hypothetical protein [Myxococcales bacterium]
AFASELRSTLEGVESRPSARKPELELAPEFDAIVTRATATTPAARHANARELHDRIEELLDGQRDVELRARLAAEHLERARMLAKRDPQSSEGAVIGRRREAMQALGRALALEPGNGDALALLRDLLLEPPAQTPVAVERAIQTSAAANNRWLGRISALSYLSLWLYLPLFAWAGIRDLAQVIPFFAAATLTAGLCLWTHLRATPSVNNIMLAMLGSNLTFALASPVFGALIVLPGPLAVTTVAFAVSLDGWRRWVAVACGALALLIPAGLEFTGVVTSSYHFTEQGLLIVPRAVELQQVPGLMFLLITGLAAIFTGVMTVVQLRDALLATERTLYTHNWQIRQLLPDPADPDDEDEQAHDYLGASSIVANFSG